MENHLEEQLTLFQGGSPASHSQPPGKEKDAVTREPSFRRCFEWWTKYGPAGSSLKTFAGCLVSNLDRRSKRLPHRWNALVTSSKRFVFQLAPSMLRTDENGFGLLGTPTSTNRERSPETMQKCADFRKRNANRNTVPLYLSEQIAMLPTPQARDYRSPDSPESGNFQRKVLEGYTIDLNSRIAMLQTPGSADGKTAYMGENREGRQENVETVVRNSTGGLNHGLKLQPAFVEYLMGYPIGWTVLED
jgi:hypothetical protein